MPWDLADAEIRVLGCLMEKQRTTPDAYPLTLNSLRLACNQSTARDPVVAYDDDIVRAALHRLERRGLARLTSGAGSRAAKFRHRLPDTLPMDEAEQAVMCVLMLRGPQTPGELKQRGERMHPFADLEEVQATLDRLIGRELAQSMARRPGQKEQRYAHRLGVVDDHQEPAPETEPQRTRDAGTREAGTQEPAAPASGELQLLAARVAALERAVAELRDALGG